MIQIWIMLNALGIDISRFADIFLADFEEFGRVRLETVPFKTAGWHATPEDWCVEVSRAVAKQSRNHNHYQP